MFKLNRNEIPDTENGIEPGDLERRERTRLEILGDILVLLDSLDDFAKSREALDDVRVVVRERIDDLVDEEVGPCETRAD